MSGATGGGAPADVPADDPRLAERQRLLREVAFAVELVKAARPEQEKPRFWETEKFYGLAGVVVGALLSIPTTWWSQANAFKQRQWELDQEVRKESRKEQLEAEKAKLQAALLVTQEVGGALAGSDKLVMIGQGDFDGAPEAATTLVEASNKAVEGWRRGQHSVELSLRIHYGQSGPVIDSWRKARDAVDEYVASSEIFYLRWRQGRFKHGVPSEGPDAQHQERSQCRGKRGQVLKALGEFGAHVKTPNDS